MQDGTRLDLAIENGWVSQNHGLLCRQAYPPPEKERVNTFHYECSSHVHIHQIVVK
jgi:hypothetical protein